MGNKSKIEYFRNGKTLGELTTNVNPGPNKAYFPGITANYLEKCRFNFGQRPLVYP